MSALRADLVFSYWIFTWFVLYLLQITTFSPKFAFLLGILDNIGMLILMLMYGKSRRTIFYFIIANTLFKVVPFYYLRKEPIKMKDIAATILLFGIYVLWLHFNNQSIISNTKILYNSLIYGENKTPFMAFLEYLKKNFKYLEIL